MFIWLS